MEKIISLQNSTFFEKVNKVHFVGVGGVSLSSLCILTRHIGLHVTGSDIAESREFDKLKNMGIEVYLGHNGCNVADDVDMVVYSGAIDESNVELEVAKSRGIKVVERSEYLGEICKLYDNVIAVAGSHGKTTTTAMITHVFDVAGLNPTMHLGGECVDYGNLRLGSYQVMITEACEYRNSMAYIRPNVAVITNIDNDHLDYYKTQKSLIKAFVKFSRQVQEYLFVSSERKFRQIGRECDLISVGFNNNQRIYAKNIVETSKGYKFEVVCDGEKLAKFKLNILGRHNIRNALFAIAVAKTYDIKLSKIKKGIRTFRGVRRRYEKIGEIARVPIISDYAHHPTEIRNSIAGLSRKYRRLLVVFQPHTYSRTELCLKEFSNSFEKAKNVIIYKTYPAREEYNPKGDEKILLNAINNKRKQNVDSVEEIFVRINEIIAGKKIDAVVVMGAGDMPIKMEKILNKTKV